MVSKQPYFRKFEEAWPVDAILMKYLEGSSKRWRDGGTADVVSDSDVESDLESESDQSGDHDDEPTDGGGDVDRVDEEASEDNEPRRKTSERRARPRLSRRQISEKVSSFMTLPCMLYTLKRCNHQSDGAAESGDEPAVEQDTSKRRHNPKPTQAPSVQHENEQPTTRRERPKKRQRRDSVRLVLFFVLCIGLPHFFLSS